MKKEKLKLLFLFWGRKGGGARYSYEISNELNNREDVNLYLSISNQCDLIEQFKGLGCSGLFIETYTTIPGFIRKWVFSRRTILVKLTRYLKKENIDIIIIGMDFFWGGLIYNAARKAGVKTIYVVHEPKPHPKEPLFMGMLKRRTMDTLNRGADHLVALTHHVKKYLIREYGFDDNHVSVIPHGIFSYYEASKAKKLPNDQPVNLLYFGSITYYKGLDILLKAYKILEERDRNVKLNIWGEGSLSEYQNLINELENVQIENRWIDESEVPVIFENSDICVLPYRQLSQSGIVGVASNAALPIVACPAGGLKEQLGEELVLFSKDMSPKSLADAIEKLINDAVLYETLSKKLLDYSKQLSWSDIANEFRKIADRLSRA